MDKTDIYKSILKEAESLADFTSLIPTERIVIKDSFAAMCLNEKFSCPGYGKSKSCPPHVGGPDFFRKWQKKSKYSISVIIPVPVSELYGEKRKKYMIKLHKAVSSIELKAKEKGFEDSRAFAGGSCKELFCINEECCVINGNRTCRNIDIARPSMSGFGVDVGELIKLSGWSGSSRSDMSWIAGLILIL